MFDIIKLILVFLIILLLLRRRWNVGYVLLVASAVLALFYLMSPERIALSIKGTVTSRVTITLLIALTFIRIFEFVLRERAILEGMMNSMKETLRNRLAVIISMPLLIGMLPSVGGAYFSAPMVKEATRGLGMSPEDKAFANYWYRHPWEYILPLYPGLILASAITSIEVRTYILLNLPYALTMFFSGLWMLRRVRGRFERTGGWSWKRFVYFLPIIGLLCLVILGHMPLHYALVILTLFLMIILRLPVQRWKEAFRHGFSKDVIVLIAGVMLFKEVLEVSGAVSNISRFFSENNIPLLPVLFLMPFITGILTGITVGFVGSTFPLIYSLTGADPHSFTFAFASGFIGVLLSPVHVCLILTREYFRADMMGVYKRIIPLALIVLVVALMEFSLL